MSIETSMEDSHIQQFYKSCNVFITGGTGFMGKILIDKLLRSTEVSTLYILVRPKKGKNAHSRLDELFDDIIFDRLRQECPKFKNRVEAVAGDCAVSGLGLTITDRQKLISDIDIVFHVAATVKFDESLKLAYTINVNGTKEVLELARHMNNLKSIIHVSTAFSNCPLAAIEEKIYDCSVTCDQVGDILRKISDKEADRLTPRMIGQWPNTYTFTKALAEQLIKDLSDGLPLGIFRPSIVISTYKEPIEGWIDNLYGPTGACAGSLSGVLRVMPCNKDIIADVIPVDTCVAALIASAWDVANNKCDRVPENITVYNYVSSVENPLTWDDFMHINEREGIEYPPSNSLWLASMHTTHNIFWYTILKALYHTIPAVILDFLLIITGNKPRVIRMYKKVHKFSEILHYFCTRNWSFSNKKVVNLWHKMNDTDKQLFPFSMTTVHWTIYFKMYLKGVRKYILKDPDSTLEAARKRLKRFQYLSLFLKIVSAYIACNIVLWLLSTICNAII